MAECHPVGFQWVMEAKRAGRRSSTSIPRFTRTSAMADDARGAPRRHRHRVPGRAHQLRAHDDRVFPRVRRAYTNATTIVAEDFRDTEDLDGLFCGLDARAAGYDVDSWQYEGMEARAGGRAARASDDVGRAGPWRARRAPRHGEPPEWTTRCEHPRCVFQVLKRHFARYTPEMVEEVCGVPRERFLEVAEALCDNSGRERTTAFVYSVGWTQHTVGVQYIRAASILQLLLGNIGRPGGGILALRGHASIQGSTDIPTLYNILPGYLPMPHAGPDDDLDDYLEPTRPPAGYWGHTRDYMTSAC